MAETVKSRFFWSVLWPDSMVENWQDIIGDTFQLPFAYAIHDGDKDTKNESRKDHVHCILVWPGPTTSKNALRVFNSLSLPGKRCANRLEVVNDVRHCYDYLIHDTDDARKAKKFLYSSDRRITGNNFDIGFYEQVSQSDKDTALKELLEAVADNHFYNVLDLYEYAKIQDKFPLYFEVFKCYSGLLSKMIDGCYQRDAMRGELRKNDKVETVIHTPGNI